MGQERLAHERELCDGGLVSSHHHQSRPPNALSGVGSMGREDLSCQTRMPDGVEGGLNGPRKCRRLLQAVKAWDAAKGVNELSRHGLMLRLHPYV